MSEYDDDRVRGEMQDASGDASEGRGDHAGDPRATREVLMRRYEVALADFRLDRSEWIWPCVAAVVNAAFVLFDPVGLMTLCDEEAVGHRYDGAAARVWDAVCRALLESVGEEDDVVTVEREHVVLHLWTCLLAEFDGAATLPADDELDDELLDAEPRDNRVDEAFVEIIAGEFGEDAAAAARGLTLSDLLGGAVPPGMVEAAGLTIDSERVRAMADAIHARCGRLRFPWSTEE